MLRYAPSYSRYSVTTCSLANDRPYASLTISVSQAYGLSYALLTTLVRFANDIGTRR
jgi:hypothetical protein